MDTEADLDFKVYALLERTNNLPPPGCTYTETDILRALAESRDSDDAEALRAVLHDVAVVRQAEARRAARRRMRSAQRVNRAVRRRSLADIDAS